MDYILRLTALFALLFSASAFADNYPATEKWMNPVTGTYVSTFDEACQAFLNNNLNYYNSWSRQNDTTCHLYSIQNQFTYNQVLNRSYSCSFGGTLNNTTHICENAPACSGTDVRNSTTGACEPPPQPQCTNGEVYDASLGACVCPPGQLHSASSGMCMVPQCAQPLLVNEQGDYFSCVANCQWPETDNGFGACSVKECASTEYRDVSTGNCEPTPQCSASETWNPSQSQCILNQLNCPGHTHANYANDACLPDAPLACPQGMHDDGTYNCVADDAKGCTNGQQRGYINGTLQCIPKPDLQKQIAQSDADKQKAANDAAIAAAKASEAAAIAAAVAAANPNDPAAQVAAAEAAAAAAAAQANASNAEAQRNMQSTTNAELDTLNNQVRDFTDPDPVNKMIAQESGKTLTKPEFNITNAPIQGFSGDGSCLADRSFSVFGNSYTLTMTPVCDFANQIRPVILSIAGVISVAIISTVI
ncbi:virulence factor TspB C-terminal domain-related protein [Methylobacter sp.]|uniref:virulence factor TspB C-terminal domain-related protein n=1 Tax=Methylobacter sp. TaxID=2051955 RepID=UPI003DA3445F